jgi:phosphopantetheine--protein transferase-like protein
MTAAHIDVLCCPLAAVDAALLARYESLLSEEELKRLRRVHSPSGAKEFLLGRALVRIALAARLQCEPRELQFTKNVDGKPALSHPYSRWQFNLSHSHEWVALALCEGVAIGVDIESYSRRNNLRAIAQRFFSGDENARLARCAEAEWLDQFFAIWTLKEAHAKALGCGLSKILACSSIAVDLAARRIDLKLSDAAATTHNVSSWLYRLDENCALALVAHGGRFSEPRISRYVPLRSMEILHLAVCARGD